MNNNYPQIQELLHQRADYQTRLNLLPYDGNPEVKGRDNKRYLYIRKRVGVVSHQHMWVSIPTNYTNCFSEMPVRAEN